MKTSPIQILSFYYLTLLLLCFSLPVQSQEWQKVLIPDDQSVQRLNQNPKLTSLELVDDPEDPLGKCFRLKALLTSWGMINASFPEIKKNSVGTLCFKIRIEPAESTDKTFIRFAFSSKPNKQWGNAADQELGLLLTNGSLEILKMKKKISLPVKHWIRMWYVLKNGDGENLPFISHFTFLTDEVDLPTSKPEEKILNDPPREKEGVTGFSIPEMGFYVLSPEMEPFEGRASLYISDLYFSDGENLTVPQK